MRIRFAATIVGMAIMLSALAITPGLYLSRQTLDSRLVTGTGKPWLWKKSVDTSHKSGEMVMSGGRGKKTTVA